MLIVISPAKTLDFESPLVTKKSSQPEFLDRSEPIVRVLRRYSRPRLAKLMGISDKLADENVQRYKDWSPPFSAKNARPCALAFRGDVYQGLDADTMGAREFDWAQKHLRILSGLYGVLRPLDLIQPYRLEMGTALPVARRRNLYEYWRETATEAVRAAMQAARTDILVNLASREYFDVIDTKQLDAQIITPEFKEKKDGALKMISFFAKKARGRMARHLIDTRATSVEAIGGFKVDRYRHNRTASSDAKPVFSRPYRALAAT